MDWFGWVQLALMPAAGVLGGFIADRRSKKNTDSVVEVSKQEAATSARNAASTEFHMITQGFSERHDQMQEQIKEQTEQIKILIAENAAQAVKLRQMHNDLQSVMTYLAAVEQLVPVEARPERPTMHWRGDT